MTGERRPRRAPRRKELGLSIADYDRLLLWQGGGCAICGNPPKSRRLDTDHDHKTGQIRGLLCHVCNRRLRGAVTVEWLLLAIGYLRRVDQVAELLLRDEMDGQDHATDRDHH